MHGFVNVRFADGFSSLEPDKPRPNNSHNIIRSLGIYSSRPENILNFVKPELACYRLS